MPARRTWLAVALATAWAYTADGQRQTGTPPATPSDAPAWFVNVASSAGVAFTHTNGASAD